MSIQKLRHDFQYDETVFEVMCDGCGVAEEIEGSFEDCRDFIKDAGWSTKKEGAEWINLCASCKVKP